MAEQEPYQNGTLEKGINTVIAYFAQSQAEELNPNNTVLEEVEAAAASSDNQDANQEQHWVPSSFLATVH